MRAPVERWLTQLPGDDPAQFPGAPAFSFERWLEEGRRLPNLVEDLIKLLEQENLTRPRPVAARAAYALSWLGEERAVPVLVKLLETVDIPLRSEAIAALGRLRAKNAFNQISGYLQDPAQDPNVRGNACIALGNLKIRESDPLLKEAVRDSNSFVAACAQEGLRLLRQQA